MTRRRCTRGHARPAEGRPSFRALDIFVIENFFRPKANKKAKVVSFSLAASTLFSEFQDSIPC